MLASQAISYSGAQHKNVNVDLKKVEQANEKKMLFYISNRLGWIKQGEGV